MADLYFSIKTGLKNIIGKDLITDDNIAIFELVKNSYDAHANDVIITFEKNKIIIADDGKGMSYNDLLKKWLAVAYSAKNDGTEDAEDDLDDVKKESYRDKINVRKYYAGAKGIGRFSCDRLGNRLTLITKKLDKPTEQIVINWNEFEKDQKEDFEKIKVPHITMENYLPQFPNNATHGTILEIENTEDWDRVKIRNLKHSLEKLINPFSETSDFNIEIISERDKKLDATELDKKGNRIIDRDKINGKVTNSILDILKLKTTQIDVNVDGNIIETKLIDRGTLIYHIKEKNNFNPYIDNLKINLYFLNRIAKFNFTNRMKVEPINYGSIFLFKNGFRVQPYGSTGDDSWELDFRAQQGRARYLGTRDVFGRVDIITENTTQFKEVSSRDGGLVETIGYKQLMDIFAKVHRRLEKYVAGVLWGEAFLRNKYFNSDNVALKLREDLLAKDKDSDDISIAKSNVGSKIDFIRLIKSLSDEKDVEIINFDKDLVDLVNENLNDVQPKFIKDLEKIAESTGDIDMQKTVTLTEKAFRILKKEKEDAEKKILEEEKRRKEAEERAKKAEYEKQRAEQKAKEENEKRLKAENEKLQSENAKLKAEQKAKEEAERRKKIEEEKKKTDLELEREKKQGIFQRSIIGREKEQILGLQHQINHSSGRIKNNVKSLLEYMGKSEIDDKVKKYISVISLESAKIESLSNFVTNANFDLKASEIRTDIIQFINDYIREIYLPDTPILNSRLKIDVDVPDNLKYKIEFRPLEITTFVDNFIQNAEKAKANSILFSFKYIEKQLIIIVSDDGKGIPQENLNRIFDLGFTTTKGSGIGLFNVKTVVKKMNGKISVDSVMNRGTTFKIEL